MLAAILLLTALIYWPGLRGGFLFDDFPNIVDNSTLHVTQLDYASLRTAALASPSSELKRPLAYLSFGLNEYFTGLAPWPMKAVNLIVHLLNALLVYALVTALLRLSPDSGSKRDAKRDSRLLALAVTVAWTLAPINLTCVLYVVQRMESLCNVFVLAGLWAYLHGRERQLAGRNGWWWIAAGLLGGTGLGLLSKESAALLPLYAMLVEWALLRCRCADARSSRLLAGLHWSMLALGTVVAMLVLPRYFGPDAYVFRPFTLWQRLLTEPRVLWTYIDWMLLPNLNRLGFYYDDYQISTALWQPPTTLFALAGLALLAAAAFALRTRIALASLGIAWFFAAHLLTATVFPLELVFEHRNYFASTGLILAVFSIGSWIAARTPSRQLLPAVAMAWIAWTGFVTALRVQEWQHPVRLAASLASKQPNSPRTQYELGRTYLVISNYDPNSPFTAESRRVLVHAALLPNASPLAEQALLIQSGHLGLAPDPSWWSQINAKMRLRQLGPQEIQSLYTLTQCVIQKACAFPHERMQELLQSALAHPQPSVEAMAIYANYAINVLQDRVLALKLGQECVRLAPKDAQYRRNLIVLFAVNGKQQEARSEFAHLTVIDGPVAANAWATRTVPWLLHSR
jgi:hypothetical protein